MPEQSEIWVTAVVAFIAAILGALAAWLLGHFSLWEIWRLVRRIRPIVWLKSKWRRRRAARIPLRAYPATGKDGGMRQFEVKEINAVDGKGKTIAGTIEPVHSGYWLDSDNGNGKAYLFGLTRQGRALAHADRLHLVVTPMSGGVPSQQDVMVKVLFTDVFDVARVSRGDYWDDLPQIHRFRAQNKLADELMDRAGSGGAIPLIQRELFPYFGVTFAVTELDELEALFPPE